MSEGGTGAGQGRSVRCGQRIPPRCLLARVPNRSRMDGNVGLYLSLDPAGGPLCVFAWSCGNLNILHECSSRNQDVALYQQLADLSHR